MHTIRKATSDGYETIMSIWASSVKATHHFLSEVDFAFFRKAIPAEYLPQLDVYVLEDNHIAKGFMAVANNNLEMLFVDAAAIGKGYGKTLLNYALQELHVTHVDVNEQNEQALAFYKLMGFQVIGRSEKDGTGKPYPILHLQHNSK